MPAWAFFVKRDAQFAGNTTRATGSSYLAKIECCQQLMAGISLLYTTAFAPGEMGIRNEWDAPASCSSFSHGGMVPAADLTMHQSKSTPLLSLASVLSDADPGSEPCCSQPRGTATRQQENQAVCPPSSIPCFRLGVEPLLLPRLSRQKSQNVTAIGSKNVTSAPAHRPASPLPP